MPTESLLALYVSQDVAACGRLRETLAQDPLYPVRLQSIEKASTALARVDGGGVALVLLDLRTSHSLDSLFEIKTRAPHVPILVICTGEALAMKAMSAGASSYLLEHQLDAALGQLLHSVFGVAQKAPAIRTRDLHDGAVISFLGVKGGAGTSTIALNVAAALARRSKVILVEMRPTPGTLAAHLRPAGLTRDLSHLVRSRSIPSNLEAMAAASVWECKKIPGLSIVFGPQTPTECLEIDHATALAIMEALTGLADYVIADLPPALSAANRAVIERSSSLAVVVERDPVAVHAAGLMVRTLETWAGTPQPIGAVIVNRSFLSTPMPLEGLPQLLGCTVLQVIPPDGDLCLLAQNNATTLVGMTADSLVASSLLELSEVIAPAQVLA